jgi:hypothetical protein
MTPTINKAVVSVLACLKDKKVRKATKILAPNLIVRATRPVFSGRVSQGNLSVVLTIGKPNFAERHFVKLCKKAGEPFPIKKVQMKLISKK